MGKGAPPFADSNPGLDSRRISLRFRHGNPPEKGLRRPLLWNPPPQRLPPHLYGALPRSAARPRCGGSAATPRPPEAWASGLGPGPCLRAGSSLLTGGGAPWVGGQVAILSPVWSIAGAFACPSGGAHPLSRAQRNCFPPPSVAPQKPATVLAGAAREAGRPSFSFPCPWPTELGVCGTGLPAVAQRWPSARPPSWPCSSPAPWASPRPLPPRTVPRPTARRARSALQHTF